jgi:octaprenyl-diphosphate synthase
MVSSQFEVRPGVADGAHDDVLARLADVCNVRGVDGTPSRLGSLLGCVEDDMRVIDAALEIVAEGGTRELPVEKSVRHLLRLKGKRLRPMCVALAARVGTGFSDAAREIAVSAELVHAATLLHDDVVDMGDKRRGEPTARVVYGNAASIFGGDWLLVEALRRINRSGIPGVLEGVLSVLNEMLGAESLQLACRGRFDPTVGVYMRIVEGKTASLFRWALAAGGRAGGLKEDACQALATYGDKLGVAFQIVDDLLDVAGDSAELGKSVYSDLREGKTTYPLLIALEREPQLMPIVRAACEAEDDAQLAQAGGAVAAALARTGALDEARAFATRLSTQAVASLGVLPRCIAREALEHTAIELVGRAK